MPDLKVDQYPPVTSWVGAELLYLIQSAADKCISLTNVFANIPVLAKFSGKFGFGTTQAITGNGAINVTATVTNVTNTAPSTLTLAAGAFDGQVKIVIGVSLVGAVTITATFGDPLAVSVGLPGTGDALTLLYTSSKWWIIGKGGNAGYNH